MEYYDEFNEFICRIMQCSCVLAGERLQVQEMLCNFSASVVRHVRSIGSRNGGADQSRGDGCLDMEASA